jgi:hypothetical protein
MRPLALALLAAGLLALPLAAGWALVLSAPAPHAPQPTAYADGSRNLTQAREGLAASGYPVASVVGRLDLAPSDALVIVPAPARAPAAAEAAALDRHLQAGGAVWVAGGPALGAWLSGYGLAMGAQPLLQLGAPAPGLVVLNGTVDGAPFPAVVATLPSVLVAQEGRGWQPILTAPGNAFLNTHSDGVIGRGDPPGPFLVGARLDFPGGGTLLVTADASLLADQAWGRPGSDNAAFVRALAQSVHPRSVLLDESQHGWPAAEGPWIAAGAATAALARLPLWAAALLTLALAAAAALALRRLPPLVPFHPHKPADPAHPPLPDEDGTALEAAWELLARRTGRPPSELREAGPEAARGLDDDPRLRRVLLGQGTPEDRRHILSAYIQETSA